MDFYSIVVLAITVFSASFLQAVTGIGYGVIAGPVLLVFFNGLEAIQISTIHNLLIAVLLFPFLCKHINHRMLWPILFGSSLGIAVGFYLQTSVALVGLKLVAASMVFFVIVTLLIDLFGPQRQRRAVIELARFSWKSAGVGVFAGVMGGMLAMPGPIVAAWMSIKGYEKNEIRATVLAFFVVAYGSTLMLYLVTTGLKENVLQLSLAFVPVVLVGVYTGNRLARHLSEAIFRKILLLVLLATFFLLLVSLSR